MESRAIYLVALGLTLMGRVSWGEESFGAPLSLTDPSDREAVLESFLAPGELPGRRIVHVSSGAEATYSLDSSLSASKPYAELHPERLSWPRIAGLSLTVEGTPLKLQPAPGKRVSDEVLDKGFVIRWVVVPLGQRFDPSPCFAIRVAEAEVLTKLNGERLLYWSEPPPSAACAAQVPAGGPNCQIEEMGLEARALALSPEGRLMALAFGGLRPRLEVYDVGGTPRLIWRVIFSRTSGGAIETVFSADGAWVVALTAKGRMHRFDAATGGRHLAIPSEGTTADAIPPGEIMAVAGASGEVKLWYLADGTIAWRLPPRRSRGPVDRLAASGDGLRFATLEYDEAKSFIRVWALRGRTLLSELQVPSDDIVDIALDEHGETLFLTHEAEGLLAAPVKRGAVAKTVSGDSVRCRGRIQWIVGKETLSCATRDGELRIDRKGRLIRALQVVGPATDWIIKASASGTRLVAVGGGRLLIWWAKSP